MMKTQNFLVLMIFLQSIYGLPSLHAQSEFQRALEKARERTMKVALNKPAKSTTLAAVKKRSSQLNEDERDAAIEDEADLESEEESEFEEDAQEEDVSEDMEDIEEEIAPKAQLPEKKKSKITRDPNRRQRIMAKLKELQEAQEKSEKAVEAQAQLAAEIESEMDSSSTPPSLEEIRLTMDKWIETQQIISKERKDWQQGKEILTSRLELVKKEIATLDEKIDQAQSSVAESDKKRKELTDENDELKAADDQLTKDVSEMEKEIQRLFKQLPEPLQIKLQPLYERIPQDSKKTRVSAAERYQNVLGILNELNKSNNEITVNYEVHKLADGKPSEVKVIYVGLAQAYYVSASGEGGIGRPGTDGWTWEPSKEVAKDILLALEILEGKHTPAFVSLPVRLQ